MKAMLLAAGEGSRLRPLTDAVPKPMIRVAGRPILEYNIRLLALHGIRDIVINLHYRPEAITDFFGDGSRWDVSITYSYEAELLGTAGALLPWIDFFDETFFVVYGDNITTCDLGQMYCYHTGKKAAGTVALYTREDPSASGIVAYDSSGRITRFLEKPGPDEIFSHWISAGILVLSPAILRHIPRGRESDFGRELLPCLLEREVPLFAYPMREKLWWFDTRADYERMCSSVEVMGSVA